jgi:uncharacterized protein (TIGR03437 family)
MLGGTFATITDYTGLQTLLPLTYTSAGQINAVIPPEVNVMPSSGPVPVPPAVLTLYTAAGIQTAVVPLVPVAPGLFSANGTGKGVANALFGGLQGATQVFSCPSGPTNCVPVGIDLTGGGQLTLYATGVRNASGTVMVNFGGQAFPATVSPVSGLPGDEGMDQVTASIPPAAQLTNPQLSGLVPVSVTAGGITSNVVYVEVQ